MTHRIGFCCKYIDTPEQVNGFKPKDPAKQFNTGTTTIRWLREHKAQAEDKLWSLCKQNLEATFSIVSKVSKYPESLRMMSVGSDLLPA